LQTNFQKRVPTFKMSSGASIKIFSDYLAKIYNLPHESSFINSNSDSQGDDCSPTSSESSTESDASQNIQDNQGKSPIQKELEDDKLSVFLNTDESRVTEVTSPLKEVEKENQLIHLDKDVHDKHSIVTSPKLDDITDELKVDDLLVVSSKLDDITNDSRTEDVIMVSSKQTNSTGVNDLATSEETVRSPFKDETNLAELISVHPKWTSPSDSDSKIDPLVQHDINIKQDMLTAVFNHKGKNRSKMLKSNKLSSRDELKLKASKKNNTGYEKVVVCKLCKMEHSCKEALIMHTCYSIMDRVIQTDGGSRRKSSKVESPARMDPSPSKKSLSQSVTKTKPRKKVNSIIAMKDYKIAKGEILVPYEPSEDTLKKKIEADRVDEDKTRVVRPILKKGSTVFNDTPQIQHTIKDMKIHKTKDEKILSNVSRSEHVQSIKVMEIHKTKLESLLPKVTQPKHVKSTVQEAEFPKVADLVLKIMKTRNILKVNMPRQRLSQLKEKAKRQDLTFKTRYYRHLKTKKDKTKLNIDQNVDVIDHGLNKRKIQEKNPSESEDLNAHDKFLLLHGNEKSEMPKRKSEDIEVELSRNIKRMKKCVVQLEHFKLSKSQRHDVKFWKNVGNQDSIIEKEAEKDVEKNKSVKKDSGQEKYHANKKLCETERIIIEDDLKSKKPKDSTMDNTKRKLKDLLQQKASKDLVKQVIAKEGKKFKTNDKFRPVDFPKPKPTVIDHFQVYKPAVEEKRESPKRVGEYAKIPPMFKEKDKRKLPKHISKNSNQCSQPGLGSPQFKIPKYKKGEQPAKKVVGFAPDRFLQNENIKVLKVGESTCSKLESLLMTAKENVPYDFGSPSLPDLLQLDDDEILDGISPLKNKMGSNRKHGAKEQEEMNDIQDEGWNQIKNLKTDPERMNLAQEQFKNPIGANPNNNVTYHGFKKRNKAINHSYVSQHKAINHSYVSQHSPDLWDVQRNLPMYHLSNGAIKPLQGYKYKLQPNVIQIDCSSKEVNSKLKIGPFANFMKTVIYNNKCKKMKRGQELQYMEEFKTYLGHYKGGCEETINFLKFYQSQEEVELEDWQTREILAMENQFSLFSGYYGDTDDLWCEECSKKHKFTN